MTLPEDHKDDAVHIMLAGATRTVCGQHPDSVMNVCSEGDPWPDPMSGCWTCLDVGGRAEEAA